MTRRIGIRRRAGKPAGRLFPYRLLPGGFQTDPAVAPGMRLYATERKAMYDAPVRPSDIRPATEE